MANDIIDCVLRRVHQTLREKELETMIPQFVQKQAVIFAAGPLELEKYGDHNDFLYDEDEMEEPVRINSKLIDCFTFRKLLQLI